MFLLNRNNTSGEVISTYKLDKDARSALTAMMSTELKVYYINTVKDTGVNFIKQSFSSIDELLNTDLKFKTCEIRCSVHNSFFTILLNLRGNIINFLFSEADDSIISEILSEIEQVHVV